MIVTVNTDASFHPKYRVAAFAFWIVCDSGRIQHRGPLKSAANPIDAELQCICNALQALCKSEFKDVSKIIINSDCLNAFERVGKKSRSHAGRVCAMILRELKKKHGIDPHLTFHEFRHVRAHSGTDEKRKWVNDWCDKEAKKELWKLIKIKTGDQENTIAGGIRIKAFEYIV